METRIKTIYRELYKGPKKKKYFAELFDVTTKTIENTMMKCVDDIVLDRSLGAYRFKNLLPNYIPYETFFYYFEGSITNQIIKNDFSSIGQLIQSQNEFNLPMLNTSKLSTFAKRIIMGHVAINSSCILEVDYVGNSKPLETKYVKPHKVITTGFTYYLYCSYEERNGENIGEYRSLAFNGISRIESIEYIKDAKFIIEGEGNAYGLIDKDKFVTLNLSPSSANFFKREGQFKNPSFDFVFEDADGAVTMKMYYNNIHQIVQLVQRWMPQISIIDNPEIANKVFSTINNNFKELSENMEVLNTSNIV